MERRKGTRKKFSYYMRMMNEHTGELLGHLSDISPVGFKLDTSKPVEIGVDFNFRIELSDEIANKKFMVFSARSKWCRQDPIDYSTYNVGFEITRMNPSDLGIFAQMFKLYGTEGGNSKNDHDYLWK